MGQGLTWHELVRLVPFLLIVMKCPQVDNHLCVLVDGILTNAVPERERKRGFGTFPFPFHSTPGLHIPTWGKRTLYSLIPNHPSFPLFLTDQI